MKVVTFNLLAQSKIKRAAFPKASHDTLKWHHRRGKLMSMISGFGADLLALQEVDYYDAHWSRFLTFDCGFEGRFKGKNDGNHVDDGRGDGLFTGWNPTIFTLVDYDVISMSPLMHELVDKGATANIAQMFVFELVHTRTTGDIQTTGNMQKRQNVRFCFANTHLYWAPGFDALRKDQVAMITAVYKQKYSHMPLILAGDLNSDPESECCAFLHQMGFVSACKRLPFTVCTLGVFVDTLDYIWVYCAGGVGVGVGVEECDLVDVDRVVSEAEGGLPNLEHPSDHLPIGANICFP